EEAAAEELRADGPGTAGDQAPRPELVRRLADHLAELAFIHHQTGSSDRERTLQNATGETTHAAAINIAARPIERELHRWSWSKSASSPWIASTARVS